MQTQIPKPLKNSIIALADRLNYESLKEMNYTLLRTFLEKKPYNSCDFSWVTNKIFLERGDMVIFNVLVPPAAKDFPDQIRKEIKQIYPYVKLASFLLTALVWWLKQHDALPVEFANIK